MNVSVWSGLHTQSTNTPKPLSSSGSTSLDACLPAHTTAEVQARPGPPVCWPCSCGLDPCLGWFSGLWSQMGLCIFPEPLCNHIFLWPRTWSFNVHQCLPLTPSMLGNSELCSLLSFWSRTLTVLICNSPLPCPPPPPHYMPLLISELLILTLSTLTHPTIIHGSVWTCRLSHDTQETGPYAWFDLILSPLLSPNSIMCNRCMWSRGNKWGGWEQEWTVRRCQDTPYQIPIFRAQWEKEQSKKKLRRVTREVDRKPGERGDWEVKTWECSRMEGEGSGTKCYLENSR